MVNINPTVEVVKEMAETMRRYANELDRVADKMVEHNDISRASEALNCVTNCMSNMRLDLLVTRPIREFTRS